MGLMFLIGIAVGVAIMLFIPKDKPAGVLRVDRSDPFEPPQLFLELHSSVDEIAEIDYAVFKVSNNSYITRD